MHDALGSLCEHLIAFRSLGCRVEIDLCECSRSPDPHARIVIHDRCRHRPITQCVTSTTDLAVELALGTWIERDEREAAEERSEDLAADRAFERMGAA